MEKLFVLVPFLPKVTDPRPYRTIVAWVLRISALLTPLLFVAFSILLWMTLRGRATFEMVLFCLVFQVVLAALLYAEANILWYRAGTIGRPVEADDYPVTLIVADLIRVFGEMAAAALAFAGVSAFLGGLFPTAGQMISAFLPIGAGSGFLMGVAGLILMAVLSFLALLLAYGSSELCRVSVDIARNTKITASRR